MKEFNISLSSEIFDQKNFRVEPKIKKIVICTTPRTAGHTLSYLMFKAGWGAPAEYFHEDLAQYLYKRWTGKVLEKREIYNHLNQYKAELLKYRVYNNIFSAKIFPENHFHYRKTFDTKNTQYIFLHRKDKFAQLISMLALYITGKPYDNNHISQHIPRIHKLDEKEINKFYKLFIIQESYWKIFSSHLPKDIQSHIFSENIITEPISGMKQLSNKFGLEINPEFTTTDLSVGGAYMQDKQVKKMIENEYGSYIEGLFKK